MFDKSILATVKDELNFDAVEVKADTSDIVWGYLHEQQEKLTICLQIDKLDNRFTAQVIPFDKEEKFGLKNYRLKYPSPVVKGDATRGITHITRSIRNRLISKIIDIHRDEIKKIMWGSSNLELASIFCQDLAKKIGLRENNKKEYPISALSKLSAQTTGVRLELTEYITINPENVEKVKELEELIRILRKLKNQ